MRPDPERHGGVYARQIEGMSELGVDRSLLVRELEPGLPTEFASVLIVFVPSRPCRWNEPPSFSEFATQHKVGGSVRHVEVGLVDPSRRPLLDEAAAVSIEVKA